jgi:hypothetical protein
MCQEYRRLFEAYHQATSVHSRAVSDLSKAASGYRDYPALWQACEKARLASERARIALDAHIAEHGCMGKTLTAG